MRINITKKEIEALYTVYSNIGSDCASVENQEYVDKEDETASKIKSIINKYEIAYSKQKFLSRIRKELRKHSNKMSKFDLNKLTREAINYYNEELK